jgi:hypothetical protein
MGNEIINELLEFDKEYQIYKKVSKFKEINAYDFSYYVLDFINFINKYKDTILVIEIVEIFIDYLIVNIDNLNDQKMYNIKNEIIKNVNILNNNIDRRLNIIYEKTKILKGLIKN